MIGSAGRWIVPLLLENLRQRYANINLRISEGTNSALEPRLVNGQLDLAVLAWPVMADELTEVDLFTEDLVVIASRDHAVGPVLRSSTLLGPRPARNSPADAWARPIRREIDDAARARGRRARAAHRDWTDCGRSLR